MSTRRQNTEDHNKGTAFSQLQHSVINQYSKGTSKIALPFFYGFILLPCPEEKQQILLQKSYAALTVVVLFNVGYYSERKSYSKDKRPDISLSSLCFYLGLSSKHGLVTTRAKQMNLTVENQKPNF
jgi:hypothetical protein